MAEPGSVSQSLAGRHHPGAIAGFVGGLGVVLWWAFFSRARQVDRWLAIGAMVVALGVTPLFVDISIATGMMGAMFYFYAVPGLSLAFVAWAVASRSLPIHLQRVDDGGGDLPRVRRVDARPDWWLHGRPRP